MIVTPLQAYATANIHLFRNAEICISRKGWIEDFQAPYYHLHVPRHLRIPPEVNNIFRTKAGRKLRLLADEEEILPGNSGLLGRRAPSVFDRRVHRHQRRGTALITDCFFKYGNIEQGHYLGVMESMMEADATWKRIRKERRSSPPSTTRRFSTAILAAILA